MTPATAKTSAAWANWVWPEDVRAFAARHGGEAHLEPLKEALARLFPTASVAMALLVLDPELRDEWSIVFEVQVPVDDVPDFLAAHDAWAREVFRICPAPKVWMFVLRLLRIDP